MSEAIASKEERLVRHNANIAAADKDPQLSPETGKPLSKVNTIRFGAGFLLFGVLWTSGLGILSACFCRCITRPSKAPIRMLRWHRQCVHRSGIPSRQPDVRQLLRLFLLPGSVVVLRGLFSVRCSVASPCS